MDTVYVYSPITKFIKTFLRYQRLKNKQRKKSCKANSCQNKMTSQTFESAARGQGKEVDTPPPKSWRLRFLVIFWGVVLKLSSFQGRICAINVNIFHKFVEIRTFLHVLELKTFLVAKFDWSVLDFCGKFVITLSMNLIKSWLHPCKLYNMHDARRAVCM